MGRSAMGEPRRRRGRARATWRSGRAAMSYTDAAPLAFPLLTPRTAELPLDDVPKERVAPLSRKALQRRARFQQAIAHVLARRCAAGEEYLPTPGTREQSSRTSRFVDEFASCSIFFSSIFPHFAARWRFFSNSVAPIFWRRYK